MVLPTLLYICETWTVYQRHDKRKPFPVKLPRETPENQVRGQDLRYGGPEQSLKIYKAVVQPTLLYACATWTVYQRHAKRHNHFHLSCLRKLLKFRWRDKVPDTEALKKAKMKSVYTLLKLAQLRWTGHVTRMSDERLPKKVFYGELQEGKRSQGGQNKKKNYKDIHKSSLKDFNIPTESWEQAAQDRLKWRCLINKDADQFESKSICEAERKRKVRKARAKDSLSE